MQVINKKWITPMMIFLLKFVILGWIAYLTMNEVLNGMPEHLFSDYIYMSMWGLYFPYLLIAFFYFLYISIENRFLMLLIFVLMFDVYSFILFDYYLYEWLY